MCIRDRHRLTLTYSGRETQFISGQKLSGRHSGKERSGSWIRTENFDEWNMKFRAEKGGRYGAIYLLQIGDIHTGNPFKGAEEGIAGSGRRAYRKLWQLYVIQSGDKMCIRDRCRKVCTACSKIRRLFFDFTVIDADNLHHQACRRSKTCHGSVPVRQRNTPIHSVQRYTAPSIIWRLSKRRMRN